MNSKWIKYQNGNQLHRMNYTISDELFKDAGNFKHGMSQTPGYRTVKFKLPHHVESVTAVGHNTPWYQETIHKLRYFMRVIPDVYYNLLSRLRNKWIMSSIESYEPPLGVIGGYQYDSDNNLLYVEIVTCIRRKSHQDLIIIYKSKVEDRNRLLESIGI